MNRAVGSAPEPGPSLALVLFPGAFSTPEPVRGSAQAAKLAAAALLAKAVLEQAKREAFDAQAGPGEGFALAAEASVVVDALAGLAVRAAQGCSYVGGTEARVARMLADNADFALEHYGRSTLGPLFAREPFGEFKGAAAALYRFAVESCEVPEGAAPAPTSKR